MMQADAYDRCSPANRWRWPTLFLLLIALTACHDGEGNSGTLQRWEFTEIHMAMPVSVTFYAHPDSARDVARSAFARIASLEAILSDYRPQSEVSNLREAALADNGGGPVSVAVSPELGEVLGVALDVARATSGAFDPTVLPVVRLWREARLSGKLPDARALDSARSLVGYGRITVDSMTFLEASSGASATKSWGASTTSSGSSTTASRVIPSVRLAPGTQIDLGGVAKGYILAKAREALEEHGVTRLLIQAGGDIVAGAAPPGSRGWRVVVPDAPASIRERAAELAEASLATSGPALQHVEIDGVRYSHVVDPRTGWALTTPATSWVILPYPPERAPLLAATADALATAFTVMQDDDRVQQIAHSFGAVAAVARHSPQR